MYCKNCGKEIEDTIKYCPYCGSSVNEVSVEEINYIEKKDNFKRSDASYNSFAIAGFILALFGFNLLAFIFSLIGLSQINSNNEQGKGFAIAGLIISCIYVIAAILIIIIIKLIFG